MSLRFSNTEDELLIDLVRKNQSLYDDKHKDFRDFQVREIIWKQIGFDLSRTADECKTRWKNIRDNYCKHLRKEQRKGSKQKRPPKWPLFEHLTFLELRQKSASEPRSEIQTIWQSDTNDVSYSTENEEDPIDQLELLDDKSVDQAEDKADDDVVSVDLSSPLSERKRRFKLSEGASRSNTPVPQSTTSGTSKKRRLLDRLEEQLLTQFVQQKEEDDVDLFMRSIGVMVKKLQPNLISKAKLQILTVVTNIQNSASSSKS